MYALEFPPWPALRDPPIDDAADGLQPFVPPSLRAAAPGHGAQALKRSSVVHRARLDEEREGGETVGEGTGGEDGLEEVGVGRALRGG